MDINSFQQDSLVHHSLPVLQMALSDMEEDLREGRPFEDRKIGSLPHEALAVAVPILREAVKARRIRDAIEDGDWDAAFAEVEDPFQDA